jgi:uncharacterized protein
VVSGAPASREAGARDAYGPLTAKPAAVPFKTSEEFGGVYADQSTEWLALPEGFQYVVLGMTGTTMWDGNRTPQALDGMGAFGAGLGRTRLVRNHENRDGARPPIGGAERAYDPVGGGGNTTMEIGIGHGGVPYLVQDFVSLNGTIVNCAGGETPWGSWISCEETTETREGVPHGYNFEIPARANGPVDPVPLKAMGRFVHEAVCVDPRTGIVYETEDRTWRPDDDGAVGSGFYRLVPHTKDQLAVGGVLQALKVEGADNYNTVTGQRLLRVLPVEWVTIDEPDPSDAESDPSAVFRQGLAQGAAIFQRLEGCWWGNGVAYFSSTNGGDAGHGQIWEYRHAGRSGGHLRLVYETPDPEVLTFPDNINVTPRGGLVLCEDTSYVRTRRNFLDDGTGRAPFSEQKLKGLTRDDRIFDLAVNVVDDREWAGACWSRRGRYLFVNTQGETREPGTVPGRTYAIWGPWEQGAL